MFPDFLISFDILDLWRKNHRNRSSPVPFYRITDNMCFRPDVGCLGVKKLLGKRARGKTKTPLGQVEKNTEEIERLVKKLRACGITGRPVRQQHDARFFFSFFSGVSRRCKNTRKRGWRLTMIHDVCWCIFLWWLLIYEYLKVSCSTSDGNIGVILRRSRFSSWMLHEFVEHACCIQCLHQKLTPYSVIVSFCCGGFFSNHRSILGSNDKSFLELFVGISSLKS